jgi:hypothetical protein
MPNVTVTPPSTIKVQVGTNRQPIVQSSSTFSGSPVPQEEINAAFNTANASYSTANTALSEVSAAYNQSNVAIIEANSALIQVGSAYNQSNIAYSLANTALPSAGGEITGNLIVDGTFTAIIDAGTF